MPDRKVATADEARVALRKSCLEWGLKPDGADSSFLDKITIQATSNGANQYPIVIKAGDLQRLPEDLKDAIERVYTQELEDYRDMNEKMFNARLESENLHDSLEPILKEEGNANQVEMSPNFIGKDDGVVLTKRAFRFQSNVNPLERFKILDRNFSRAELAYLQSNKEGWRDGYGFEAILVAHAIQNEPCYSCKKKGVLFWCGGSETSWRDLYCQSCESCFEVKSKKDLEAVDKVFQYGDLRGGSYRRWCKESFSGRGESGRDYVVLVSRSPFASFSEPPSASAWAKMIRKDTWKVDIAEIDQVVPQLTAMTFVDESAGRDRVTMRTTVKVSRRSEWFHIPFRKSLELAVIQRKAFEHTFPGQWDKLVRSIQKKSSPLKAPKTTQPLQSHHVATPRWSNIQSHRVAKTNNYKPAATMDPYSTRSHNGAMRTAARSDLASLERRFGGMSVHDEEDYHDDYDYDDIDDYLCVSSKGLKTTGHIIGDRNKYTSLRKVKGYKVNHSGHYGKRGSGGKKGQWKKYDGEDW